MTLYVARLVMPLQLERALSSQEEAVVREDLRLIRRFIDDQSPYAALIRNYLELDRYLTTLDTELTSHACTLQTAQQVDAMMLEANRFAMNFLSSVRSYLDITPHRLGSCSPPTQRRFAAWCSVQYDLNLSYRILENLRGVAQHQDLPVRAFASTRQGLATGNVQVVHELLIDRDSFLSAKLQAPVRTEVEALGDHIPFRPHLKSYYESLLEIQLQVLRDIVPQYVASAERIDSFVREVGDPQSVPIYFAEAETASGGRIDVTVLDAHLHGVALIRQAAQAVEEMDFTALDAAAQAHSKWPG
jgi:hypothetical protein